MRRALTLVLLAVAALAAGASPAAADFSLTPLRGAGFPDRQFVLTVPPGAAPTTSQVHVRENGIPVDRLQVVAVGTRERRRIGTVLVIDTSASMKGRAIGDAIAAARAFAAHRVGGSPFAVVTFSSASTTLLPFTTEPARIDAALSRAPSTGGGTHLYDAVESALGMIRDARLDGGAVVVLSDGSDRGSRTGSGRIVADADALHARLYTVGLRSGDFSPKVLSGLASGGHGAYSEASSPRQLTPIFRSLGSQLANVFTIRYRSLAGPHTGVSVTATVDGIGGTATARYESPALPSGAYLRGRSRHGWGAPAAITGVSVAVALLLGLGVGVAMRSRAPSVRDRVAPFIDDRVMALPLGEGDADEETDGEESLLARADARLARLRGWQRFKEAVDVARVPWPAARLAGVSAASGLLLAVLVIAVTGSPAGILLAPLLPGLVCAWVQWKARKQRELFGEQLVDNLTIVASALRAGHGFVGALGTVLNEAPEPSRSELRRVIAEEQLGTPIDEALAIAVRRMRSQELEQVALVASLQRETGGNVAEVLDRVVESVRERISLRRLIKTLTAQGRLSGGIVSVLPAALLAMITALNPGFMKPMYATFAGNAVLVLSAALILTGWLVIRRIITIEV